MRTEAIIDEQLAYLLRPGGKIDTKARAPLVELMSMQVTLEGTGVRVRMPMYSWLRLTTEAECVLWGTVAAEDAKQLAIALAKVDLGPQWRPAIKAVQMVGLAGEFRVVEEAGD
jgi:hypothetical protein